MDLKEFTLALFDLFEEYEFVHFNDNYKKQGFGFKLHKDDLKYFMIHIGIDDPYFVMIELEKGTYQIEEIYKSKYFPNSNRLKYEELFDEIVVFKELILPKYL